jgi:hypothetical protein
VRILSGAIVILAGAILFGAGAVAEAILATSNGYTSAGRFALVGGAALGFVGLALLIAGPDRPARP